MLDVNQSVDLFIYLFVCFFVFLSEFVGFYSGMTSSNRRSGYRFPNRHRLFAVVTTAGRVLCPLESSITSAANEPTAAAAATTVETGPSSESDAPAAPHDDVHVD